METYDFRANVIDDLANMTDCLTITEAEQAIKAIQEIQEHNSSIRQENYLIWFQAAVTPILKDFAELNNSLLEIETKNLPVIVAVFKNDSGFCLTESCLGMKTLFALAIQLGFEKDGPDFALTIVFDCNKIL